MGRIVTEAEARRDLERLLDEARYPGEHVVIERDGEPVAVLVSVAEARAMREQTRERGERIRELLAALQAGFSEEFGELSEDEINEISVEAIRAVRADARAAH